MPCQARKKSVPLTVPRYMMSTCTSRAGAAAPARPPAGAPAPRHRALLCCTVSLARMPAPRQAQTAPPLSAFQSWLHVCASVCQAATSLLLHSKVSALPVMCWLAADCTLGMPAHHGCLAHARHRKLRTLGVVQGRDPGGAGFEAAEEGVRVAMGRLLRRLGKLGLWRTSAQPPLPARLWVLAISCGMNAACMCRR